MILAKVAGGEVAAYPYTPAQLRADNPGTSFPADLDAADLSDFGVVEVQPNPAPTTTVGQIAEELPPAFINGQWEQNWQVRSKTGAELAEAKITRRRGVDARLAEVFEGGFTPTTGPLAGHTLQTRGIEDRTNWLTSQAAYSAAVAGGHGDVVGATFRTVDNVTVTCTYAEGLQTLLAMAAWGATVMGAGWAIKDAIANAATFAALEAIDVAAGWPE